MNALAVSPNATFAKANSKKAKSLPFTGEHGLDRHSNVLPCATCRRGVAGELLEQCEVSFDGYFIVFVQGEIGSCRCRLQRSDAFCIAALIGPLVNLQA